MKIEYALTAEQEAKFNAWYKEQDLKAVKAQSSDKHFSDNPCALACFEHGYPYSGAIGVGPTWIITSNSVAGTIKVRHWFTKEELDLTDYENW